MDGTGCGIRMKSERGRGGVVEQIVYRGITMRNILSEAVQMTLNCALLATATPSLLSFRVPCCGTDLLSRVLGSCRPPRHQADQRDGHADLPRHPDRGRVCRRCRLRWALRRPPGAARPQFYAAERHSTYSGNDVSLMGPKNRGKLNDSYDIYVARSRYETQRRARF